MAKQQTEIIFKPETFNPKYFPYLNNKDRLIIYYGGAGSGESYYIAQQQVYRCLKDKYYRLVFSRKIAKTIRNSQFQLFKDILNNWKIKHLFNIKESTMDIECENGNKMISYGLDDREKIKSITDPNVIWAEEATEYEREDIQQLNLRLRSLKAEYNQLIFSFNPIDENSFLNNDYFISGNYTPNIIHSTYKDNKFLPGNYRKELEALELIDKNYHNIYALGKWGGKAKGLIYSDWTIFDQLPEGIESIYGLDFGFNHPTALTKVSIKENNIYIEELIYQTHLTNSDLITKIKTFNIGKVPIYADAAEPQRIEEIYRAGFNIKPANKSVKDGLEKMKRKKIFIKKDSTNILKEIRQYKWKEDKNCNQLDEPVKFMDDALDSIRYAVHTHTLNERFGHYSTIRI